MAESVLPSGKFAADLAPLLTDAAGTGGADATEGRLRLHRAVWSWPASAITAPATSSGSSRPAPTAACPRTAVSAPATTRPATRMASIPAALSISTM
ncbi:hypothetical protein [Streptosporangium minutum]|uniref:Uncharacterized protein n=1 Tax=Streptosporangium minutum TaxID=569862 RepID=A0A243QGH9_9ACTN|nr:hypothetical protein [Streptosporangium minutum]OUC81216.1 hypothetical protein CA984_42010 [Streptosporangium minutum]